MEMFHYYVSLPEITFTIYSIYGFHVCKKEHLGWLECHQCSHQPPGLGMCFFTDIGRTVDAIWKSGYKKYHHLRPYQQTPKGAYPKPPGPTVYGSEFLNHLGVKGDVWGMRNRGMLGFP